MKIVKWSKVEGRDALFAHLHLKTVWGGAAVAALRQFGVLGLGSLLFQLSGRINLVKNCAPSLPAAGRHSFLVPA